MANCPTHPEVLLDVLHGRAEARGGLHEERASVGIYPTVIRALLARTGDTFVQELSKRPHMDGEEAAVELARTN